MSEGTLLTHIKRVRHEMVLEAASQVAEGRWLVWKLARPRQVDIHEAFLSIGCSLICFRRFNSFR